MIDERVIVAGFGGQGVMLMGQILSYAATEEDLNTAWIPSYGPETRGGTANCSVVISKPRINSPVVSEPDTLIVLNQPSLDKFEKKLKKGGKLLVNKSLIDTKDIRDDVELYAVDCNKIALDIGNLKVANMVMLGAYIALTGIFEKEAIFNVFDKIFTGAKSKLIDLNKQAIEAGIKAVES